VDRGITKTFGSVVRPAVLRLALAGFGATLGCRGGADGDGANALNCSTFAVAPAEAVVDVLGTLRLDVTGGSGTWRADLVEDPSGGTVGGSTGVYVAGSASGVIDRIEVTDEACGRTAEVVVTVVGDLALAPREASVTPGETVRFEVSGGGGTPRCGLRENGSGASLSADCAYTAGAASGQDVVRFEDPQTGEAIDAWIGVDPSFVFDVAGRGGLFQPLGARFRPTPVYGSGSLTLSVVSGALAVDGDAWVGAAAAAGTLRVADRYTGATVDVPASVLAPRTVDAPRDGERTELGVVVPLGDKDGDGFVDVAFGSPEISIDAHQGGGVAVYAGRAGGLLAEPTMTLAGTGVYDALGDGLAVADVTGDGELDLLVGASRTDRVATNVGAVAVHPGIPGGFFEEAPSRTLYGLAAYDRLGTAIAACDFDGDGFVDLAAGAEDATFYEVADPARDQGAVYVWRGSPEGFADRADVVLYGVAWQAGAWVGVDGLGVGRTLVAEDFDGDGRCDLAAGGPDGGLTGADGDGVVLVYRGTSTDGLLVERTPAWTVAPSPGSGAGVGRALAAGDVDGDGAAELVVGAWTDGVGGRVAVFAGGVRAAGAVLSLDDAEVVAEGVDADGRFGASVALRDVDGVGGLDLVVGASQEEIAGADQGVVHVYGALDEALAEAPSSLEDEDAPLGPFLGVSAGDELGQALDGVGDLDGDGRAEIVALAGLSNLGGVDVGAPYVLSAQSDPYPLTLPGVPSGHDAGRSVVWMEADATPGPDLVVGAPGAGDPVLGANAGWVEVFGSGGASGVQPFGVLDHLGVSDRNGVSLARGDVDGDGREDLIVAARSDSRPSAFVGNFVNPTACPGARSSAGAVRVFRGTASGLSPTPAFLGFGPVASGTIPLVAGGFDHNGDGRDDIGVASTLWGDGGGYGVFYGAAANATKTTVLCWPEVAYGEAEGGKLGTSIAGVGDLDGDGCDELAVGAPAETLEDAFAGQGALRVVWGHGATCASPTASVTTLALRAVGTGLGGAVAGGVDIDGDGVPDVVVGAPDHRVRFAELGAVWVVSGAEIATYPRAAVRGGIVGTGEAAAWSLLLPDRGLTQRVGVFGTVAGSRFGSSLAVFETVAGPRVVVGAPFDGPGGTAVGGVSVFRWTADGLEARPWWAFGGEATSGELGAALDVGWAGDAPQIVVGAPRSDQGGVDVGAAYVVPLPFSR
jgi:hypothetical protein